MCFALPMRRGIGHILEHVPIKVGQQPWCAYSAKNLCLAQPLARFLCSRDDTAPNEGTPETQPLEDRRDDLGREINHRRAPSREDPRSAQPR